MAAFVLGTKLSCLVTFLCHELKTPILSVSSDPSVCSKLLVCLLVQFSGTAKIYQKTAGIGSVVEARQVNLVGRIRMKKKKKCYDNSSLFW